MHSDPIAFIGGGNMASALIGGLRRAGVPAARITVVEPFEAQRDKLLGAFGVRAQATADAIAAAWEKITDQIGRDSQIALYKASLGM